MKELTPNDLNSVNGGTSPMTPKMTPGSELLNMVDNIIGGDEVQETTVIAFCKACGSQVLYLGQTRVEGGNTGKYQCNNPACAEFGKIKYNDEVNIQ